MEDFIFVLLYYYYLYLFFLHTPHVPVGRLAVQLSSSRVFWFFHSYNYYKLATTVLVVVLIVVVVATILLLWDKLKKILHIYICNPPIYTITASPRLHTIFNHKMIN